MRRREALKTMAAAAVLPKVQRKAAKPAGPHHAPEPEPQAKQDLWKPLVLDPHQDRTVTVLAELIIPRTDTPGAADAQVNRYIDRMLADSPPSVRREFLGGLAWLDGHCNEKYGAPLADLSSARQIEVLTALSAQARRPFWGPVAAAPEASANERALQSAAVAPGASNLAPGARFFRAMKGWTASGYYSSKVGLEQELGWGKNPATEPPGCPNPEEHKV